MDRPHMSDKRGPQESQSLLELRSGREGDTHTLYLGGELDAASAAALGRELDWIELGDAKAQVLDLSALTFIDSAGLSLLVRASSDFGRDERPLRVVGARGQVRAVLERTGVSESLDLGD
jgi:anti-sigma B factor antagonist